VLRDPAILRGAVHFLDEQEKLSAAPAASGPDACERCNGAIDWTRSANPRIYRACALYAWAARRLAEQTGRPDPENAWVAGLLAPLGWLAVCAVTPDQAAACLTDGRFADDADATQEKHWGYTQNAIARRLCRRWQLPRWLAVIIGHLGLKVDIAQSLGADPALFQLLQAAIGLVQQSEPALRLKLATGPAESAMALSYPAREQESLLRELSDLRNSAPVPDCSPADRLPLLRELLNTAVDYRLLCDAPVVDQLESERDRLERALESQQTDEVERLQTLKLKALAEFSAGAAHEINNPLAVISGQAQYLIGRDSDPARQRALQTIIGQTQRIHQVLSDLMQFARPARPQRQTVDIRSLVREVTLSLTDMATRKEIRLTVTEPESGLHIVADARQVRAAVECLLRNAIEAAPTGGWASLQVASQPDRVEFIVEDSGNAPHPSQREHLFDPFYSGRQAGRGRGLGLPTAWRLARENGGDVRLDESGSGPTRFTLTLPRDNDGRASATSNDSSAAAPAVKLNGRSLPVLADL
jgi:signal transduction histidine kinase